MIASKKNDQGDKDLMRVIEDVAHDIADFVTDNIK